MKDSFVIYVDRLSSEREEPINLAIEPDFLGIHERELAFEGEVQLKGKAYVANEHLIIDLSIHAEAYLPCRICNEMRPLAIDIEHTLVTREISEIRGSTYDFSHDVRDAILIEVPSIFECNGGNCPERGTMEKYLSKKETPNGSTT